MYLNRSHVFCIHIAVCDIVGYIIVCCFTNGCFLLRKILLARDFMSMMMVDTYIIIILGLIAASAMHENLHYLKLEAIKGTKVQLISG